MYFKTDSSIPLMFLLCVCCGAYFSRKSTFLRKQCSLFVDKKDVIFDVIVLSLDLTSISSHHIIITQLSIQFQFKPKNVAKRSKKVFVGCFCCVFVDLLTPCRCNATSSPSSVNCCAR